MNQKNKIKKIVSTCIYCGCGCKLIYHVKNNKILKISGFSKDYMSEGKPCIKGLTINEVFDKNRITHPYIRKAKKLVKVSWNDALNRIYEKTKNIKSDEIFLNGSGKVTNEHNFLIYKLGTCLFNTANIDSCCGRLCHISTVKGVMDCFGASNLTKISNIDNIDTLFIIGSNPAVNYPVFWNKILKRKNKIKIISVQSLFNLTSKLGNVFLEIEPGTETLLLNGIINYLIKNNSFDKKARNFKNFKKLEKLTAKYNISYICKECEINEKEFLEVCKAVANSKKLGIFHGMGFTQHINSLENVHSLLNLVLFKNADLLTLRGEINVQGVGDVFSSNTQIFSKLWNKKIIKPKGNLIKSLILNPVKVAFITEFNPAQSLPNLNKVHKNLEKMFIVYFGSYFNLTCDYADVILPVPTLFESLGTITNGEQRLILSNKPLKYKNPDMLEITKLLAKKFTKESLFLYKDSKQIFKELIMAVPDYNKIDADKIYLGEDTFAEKNIKYKRFFPEDYKGKDDKITKKFPFLLTTFREQHHFLTSEITDYSKTLRKLDKDRCHIFINPRDAEKLKIKDEDKINVISETSDIQSLARISDKVPKNLVATRFHYKEMLVNKLFPSKFDDVTFTPNYKCCAVRIEKL